MVSLILINFLVGIKNITLIFYWWVFVRDKAPSCMQRRIKFYNSMLIKLNRMLCVATCFIYVYVFIRNKRRMLLSNAYVKVFYINFVYFFLLHHVLYLSKYYLTIKYNIIGYIYNCENTIHKGNENNNIALYEISNFIKSLQTLLWKPIDFHYYNKYCRI